MTKKTRYFIIDKNFNIVNQPVPNKKKSSKKIFSVVNYLNIGYYILTPILVGVFLGLVIDRHLKMNGTFTVFFILLGSVAAFYNLYKIYKNG